MENVSIEKQLEGIKAVGFEAHEDGACIKFENGLSVISLADVEGNGPGVMLSDSPIAGATVTGIYRHPDEYHGTRNEGVTPVFSNGAVVQSASEDQEQPGHMVLEDEGGDQWHIFPKEFHS